MGLVKLLQATGSFYQPTLHCNYQLDHLDHLYALGYSIKAEGNNSTLPTISTYTRCDKYKIQLAQPILRNSYKVLTQAGPKTNVMYIMELILL